VLVWNNITYRIKKTCVTCIANSIILYTSMREALTHRINEQLFLGDMI
jgi:hypothetical protein